MIAAVLVPGIAYSVDAPLFDFAGEALERRGAHIHPIRWTFPRVRDRSAQAEFVSGEVRAALDAVSRDAPTARVMLIAKSIGTFAAPIAAERALPAVWLTPLLTEGVVVDAIARNPAPTLLVGGTADRLWRSDVARELGHPCIEIPDGDHGLYVPGPLRESAAVLGTVATAVESFLDALVN